MKWRKESFYNKKQESEKPDSASKEFIFVCRRSWQVKLPRHWTICPFHILQESRWGNMSISYHVMSCQSLPYLSILSYPLFFFGHWFQAATCRVKIDDLNQRLRFASSSPCTVKLCVACCITLQYLPATWKNFWRVQLKSVQSLLCSQSLERDLEFPWNSRPDPHPISLCQAGATCVNHLSAAWGLEVASLASQD